ncbi:MAG: bifunctional 3-(3-hydroxy-phenyl)propionate/3-hydroxycinnamic acid hydroxylase [Devosia sp.]|nr:bifunctional 3-(3-hydroxy-phenyl)propionate/3-hydroxycinnamic acid hydroxylase [Devosia sp.]
MPEPKRLQTDVLVVGAGPTGLTIANFLGKMGVDAILAERNATTVEEPRAVSIDDESMRTMQAIGLNDAVEAIVARGYGSRYLGPSRDCFLVVEPESREYGFDKRNGFQQPDLEAVLRGGLERYANIRQFFGHELIGFTQDATGVIAELQGPGGTSVKVSARYMVGADGGRSFTRKQLGIELSGFTFAQRWLIVDLVATLNRFRHTEVFCDPRRPCISLPGPDGMRRYEFMLKAGEDDQVATSPEFVRRLLSEVGPDWEAQFRRVRVYTFHARMADSWRKGRVFLAGDAAHLTPPFAGQGMNSGLRDAHNLSWKLAEAVSGDDQEEILDSYQIERRPHAWEMITLALRMGQVMMPAGVWQGLLVRSAFRVLGFIPTARDYFLQMRYKPKPSYRKGLRWSDGRSARKSMVGRLLPQPVVESPRRQRMLLDNVLPDQPVVLVFDEHPDNVLDAGTHNSLGEAGAAVIGLTPEWMNPHEKNFAVYRDVSKHFSGPDLASYLGHAFLLRRDRYVAAIVPITEVATLVPLIGRIRTNAATPGQARNSRLAANA